ncbi:class I SAM-dependent methyltransferase [Micromonospora coxensis]|uniref:class I SAM-dependent methyltransferase n=1 Tax=Micromonospora coxensis TaxID=356852 RepID=UPI003435257F
MARIAYDERAAAAFAATRHLDEGDIARWQAAVGRHLRPRPGLRLLDLGAGTGTWSIAFRDWYDAQVVAVEPSPAMRARAVCPGVVAARAEALPFAAGSLDGAWLSTVIHHLPDLPVVADGLRRVLRPGAPVLVRSVFAGRGDGISLFRWFPEAARVLDSYPSVTRVRAAFAAAGFPTASLERVSQVSAARLAEAAAGLRREAHTPLMLLDDDAFARGLDRLRRAAARTPDAPVVDRMDLLVLR